MTTAVVAVVCVAVYVACCLLKGDDSDECCGKGDDFYIF